VHHLNARIPNYNLQRAHNAHAIFADVPTLSLADGLRSVRLKLWDEEAGRLVTFAQAARRPLTPAALGRARSAPGARGGTVQRIARRQGLQNKL